MATFPRAKTRFPPPKDRYLVEAARWLPDEAWLIGRRDDDPRRFELTGDPNIASLFFRRVPPESGTAREYARLLIVLAAMGIAADVPSARVDLWASMDPPSATEGERERTTLQACRNWICTQVEDIALHGEDHDGVNLGPFDALMRHAKRHMLSAELMLPAALENEGPIVSAAERLGSASPPLWPHEGPQSSAGLSGSDVAKAVKYVFSSGINLKIAVVSLRPMRFVLEPGSGFKSRFDAMIKGSDGSGLARTLVLRLIVDVVDGLDEERVRTWLPSVDWSRFDVEAIQSQGLEALMAELKRKVGSLIDLRGPMALARYRDHCSTG